MKTVINLVLAACVVGLIYICYGSVMGPINFEKERDLWRASSLNLPKHL